MRFNLLTAAAISWLMMIALVSSEHQQAFTKYLYDQNHPPILEYSGSNTNRFWQETNKPRVVEFYSPTCPACVNFAPEYIKLAKSILESHPGVFFYAVSCDHHNDVCQKYGVDGFPSLFVFPKGSTSGTLIDEEPGLRGYSTKLLVDKLLLRSKNQGDGDVALDHRRMDDSPNGESDARDEGDGTEENEEENEEEEDASEENEEENEEEENASEENEDENEEEENASEENEDGEEPEQIVVEDEEAGDPASEQGEEGDPWPKEEEGNGEDSENEEEEDGANSENGDEEEDEEEEIEDEEDESDEEDEMGMARPIPGGKMRPMDIGAESGYFVRPRGVEEEDDEDEEEEESEEEYDFGGRPYVPPLPPPPGMMTDHFSARPGAGASLANAKIKKLDRYKEEMKRHKDKVAARHRGVGKLIRKNPQIDARGRVISRTDPEAMTTSMRMFTPGTPEYEDRRKKLIERVEKFKKRSKDFHYQPSVFKKETLPFRKDVRHPKLREKIPIVKRIFKMPAEEELILDATVSFVVGLESGVSLKSNGELNATEKKALKAWLDLLSVSLPPEWAIHSLIDDLARNMAYISRGDTYLRQIINKHPLPRRNWSHSCVFGKRGMVGFSCGFWKLLHVVTVGVAEQRGGHNLIDADFVGTDTETFSPMDAANTIRNYIDHFFTCTPCRKHFVGNYDDCENNRRCDRLTDNADQASHADWKQLPIWLWEVHNEVSVRILNERAQKENIQYSRAPNSQRQITAAEELGAIFPNIETCFMCFNDDGTWDEEQVFKLLEKTYWPDAELDPKADKLLRFEGQTDSTPFLLWLVVIAVVYVIYKAIGNNSAPIHQSLLKARLVSQQVGLSAGGIAGRSGRTKKNSKDY